MKPLGSIRHLLPPAARKPLRTVRRWIKRAQVRQQRKLTRADIVHDLQELGILPGDALLLHSALSKIGFVEGGADAVIDAFLEVLGPQGTLLMPSFPFDTYIEAYLKAHPSFDVATTPSRMGKITEVFRNRPGVQRSLHPTHPVAALGPLAGVFTANHDRAPTTFGPGSPFHTMCEHDVWILLLGVDFHAMTHLHVVEDTMADFPYDVYAPEPYAVEVRSPEGVHTMRLRVHSRELSALRDCNKMEQYFLEAGVLRIGRVGEAEARRMSSAGVLRTMTELAARGITMYHDDRVPAARRKRSAPS